MRAERLAARKRLGLAAAGVARRLGATRALGGEWAIPPDCDPATAAIIGRVEGLTLTPPARLMALCAAVRYIDATGIDGAVAECGVWRGGSMIAAALTLLERDEPDRDLHLYDTFTEMPPPGPEDAHISGRDLQAQHAAFERGEVKAPKMYELYPIDRVRRLLEETGYPAERLHFAQGMVEETIPDQAPERIALCRLDTDYYESTAHELRHLYPRIVPGGILIIDDYGEFAGARKAVDEHLAGLERPPFMTRVDASCRLLQVPPSS